MIGEGRCPMCGAPILIDTKSVDGRMQIFCADCEKKVNEKIAASLSRRGKAVRNKRLIFPKAEEND